uniref:F-box domain-containing protein n=1 Tax=Bionectria ochroleuca TaxID=29856 RepID=A0A8H7N863_BIOOC
MAITLSSLPNELLLQLCKRLASDTDLSNFRLVCRLFGEVGLPALGTRVTFALLPESINRLRDISLDPVFRRHTTTVVCLMNVFYPYSTVRSLKLSMANPLTSGNQVAHEVGLSEDDWAESMMHYNLLLAAQDKAFRTLESSQDIQVACRRFVNLQNLHIRDARGFQPDHLRSNQAYQFLSQRHGDLTHCSVLPAFNFSVFPHKIALPGVYLLSSLFGAITESQLRTLQVDALALELFQEEDEVYSHIRESIQSLRTLKLCIWAASEDGERERADRILSKNRLKKFLCSAPHLEVLEVSINGAFFGTGIYYANSAYILPRENTWHRIRRLRFSQVEFLTSDFLDFLSFHGHTLEYVGLRDCAIVGPPSQGLQRCFWSDILIPLATTYSLATLSLSGWFTVPAFLEQDQSQMKILPAMNMEHDIVKDVKLSVGEAIEMAACSKNFNSFLQAEVGRRNGLAMDTDGSAIEGLAVEIKEGIIRDLMDREPVRPTKVATEVVPTRYSDYLKLFTQDYESAS